MKILKKILNLNYKILISNYLAKFSSYLEVKTLNGKLFFFAPNYLIKWRVDTFFTKEPETLKWIDEFKENEIFWDIGANIGLYAIYAAKKKLKVICFEPSTNNTRILSRNISKNNMHNQIYLFPIALTDVENKFLTMNESNIVEGSAHNSFGQNLDYEGKSFEPKCKYSIFGTSIDRIIKDRILEKPNHIKIDVDGFEHLILSGARNLLSTNELKTVLIEINENYKEQFEKILQIFKSYNFSIIKKTNLGGNFYNYVFKNNKH